MCVYPSTHTSTLNLNIKFMAASTCFNNKTRPFLGHFVFMIYKTDCVCKQIESTNAKNFLLLISFTKNVFFVFVFFSLLIFLSFVACSNFVHLSSDWRRRRRKEEDNKLWCRVKEKKRDFNKTVFFFSNITKSKHNYRFNRWTHENTNIVEYNVMPRDLFKQGLQQTHKKHKF